MKPQGTYTPKMVANKVQENNLEPCPGPLERQRVRSSGASQKLLRSSRQRVHSSGQAFCLAILQVYPCPLERVNVRSSGQPSICVRLMQKFMFSSSFHYISSIHSTTFWTPTSIQPTPFNYLSISFKYPWANKNLESNISEKCRISTNQINKSDFTFL